MHILFSLTKIPESASVQYVCPFQVSIAPFRPSLHFKLYQLRSFSLSLYLSLSPFFKLIATNHHRPSPIATVTPPLHFPTTISQLRVWIMV
ncbi:hypothetical protein L1887_19368 [Cichorium endivia]|nr:hypothetical protein L1887_19368 [Cichorium endivia]